MKIIFNCISVMIKRQQIQRITYGEPPASLRVTGTTRWPVWCLYSGVYSLNRVNMKKGQQKNKVTIKWSAESNSEQIPKLTRSCCLGHHMAQVSGLVWFPSYGLILLIVSLASLFWGRNECKSRWVALTLSSWSVICIHGVNGIHLSLTNTVLFQ